MLAPVLRGYELPEDSSRNSLLVRFFSNPIVGLIGWLATVLSLILTIYFYREGKDVRNLTYYVHPIKTVLVRAGQASRLTTDFDGKRVQGDITAAQVAFWNQGNLPIKTENILKPIILYTDNKAPILEATVRKRSRDVTGISLGAESLQQGRLAVSWNILEGNDGGVIQLIYAGGPETNLLMDGVVEGQRQIAHLQSSGRVKPQDEQFFSELHYIKLLGTLILIGGVICLSFAVLLIILRSRRRLKTVGMREQSEDLENLNVSALESGKLRELVDKYLKARHEEPEVLRRRSRGLLNTLSDFSTTTSPIPPFIFGLLFCGFGTYFILGAHQLGPPFGF